MSDTGKIAAVITTIAIVVGSLVAIWTQHYSIGAVADGEQVQLGIKAGLSLLEVQVVAIVILSVVLYNHRSRIRQLEGKNPVRKSNRR